MKFLRKKQTPNITQRRRPGGGGQPGVFSYYSQRTSPSANTANTGRGNSSETADQSRRFSLGYLPSYIALVIVTGAVLYSFWLQPLPRITVVSQPATVYQETSAYQQEIETIWRKSLLNQSKLTIRSGTIRTDILERFSELADVRIELPLLGRRPAVTLVPAQPAFQLVSGNGIFYVNASGKVMAHVTDVTKNELPDLPMVRDESGIDAEVGKSILPEPQALFLQKLSQQLIVAKLPVQSITLPSYAASQADVRLVNVPYFIKFSTDVDPRQGVGTYVAVTEKLQADGVTPKEYIDVRVEEKVFYR